MNYKKVYKSIIKNRQNNPIEKSIELCTEVHHIKPKSIGGSDKKDNLIRLTTREHFVCHCLLAKMYKSGSNDWYMMNTAFVAMKMNKYNNRYVNSRLYDFLRVNYWKENNRKRESKGIKYVQSLCYWMDINGRVPQRSSEDCVEVRLANKLSTLKQAKKGVVNTVFYSSYELESSKLGYDNIFDMFDNESEGLEKLKEIIDFCDENNKLPSSKSTDSIERRLGKKLSSISSAKDGKNDQLFFESFTDLIVNRGYPNLFNSTIQRRLFQIKSICEWISIHRKYPSRSSNCDIEKGYAYNIYTLRRSYRGKTKSIFHKCYSDEFTKHGCEVIWSYKY